MEYDKNFIMNIAGGFMGTFVLSAACEIRLFDAMADGRKSLSELSEITGTESSQLIRLIRPLLVYRFILKDNDGMYSLSRSGNMLVSTDSNSMWGYVVFCGREGAKVWSKISQALTEKCSLHDFFGNEDMFEKQSEDNGQFMIFDGMMKNVSAGIDFSGFFAGFGDKNMPCRIVDIGGGTGTIISKFLDYYPNTTGTIIDLAQTEQEAEKNISCSGLAERCVFRQGNFFENIDISGDWFILSRVLHDWNDEDAVKILENVSACLDDNSKLLVIENIMTESTDKSALETYMNDIQMWGFCGSKERTEEEFKELFANTGLVFEEVRPTSEKSSVYVMIVSRNNIEEGEI